MVLYRWFSHDVTKIQTKKLSILPRFYIYDALEQLKNNFHTNLRFKRVLGFVIESDLLQVDLLASGASLFWPRSGRPRATKSREDLSRLQGFHLHFAPKMGGGVTRIWGFRFHLRVLDCPDSTPTKSIEHVCVSPSSKEQICFLCAKVVSNNDFRRKLTTILPAGKEISSDCFLTNILCRNCADKNETLVRKLHGVRESLESSRKAITEEKGGII